MLRRAMTSPSVIRFVAVLYQLALHKQLTFLHILLHCSRVATPLLSTPRAIHRTQHQALEHSRPWSFPHCASLSCLHSNIYLLRVCLANRDIESTAAMASLDARTVGPSDAEQKKEHNSEQHSTTSQPVSQAADMSVATQLPPLHTSGLHASPPTSATSSPGALSKKRSRSPLSIDLSSMPGLTSPAPPSNTLLITRLTDPKIFHPASLATIRQHLNSIAALNSFSPLKSMARIIVSFYTEQDCIKVRQEIDGSAFTPTVICKCYFGEPTPIDNEKKYLERPDAGKLFFISPPPSPPVGWESKMEDPPNKEVHADDLAAKLSKLTGKMENPESPSEGQVQMTAEELLELKTSTHRRALSQVSEGQSPVGGTPGMRSRSSTLIYDPKLHGDSPNLPAVTLEAEDDSDVELDTDSKAPMAHTSRPPVELMEQ